MDIADSQYSRIHTMMVDYRYASNSYVCTNLNAIILPVFNKDFCVGSSFILAMYAVISVLSSKRS